MVLQNLLPDGLCNCFNCATVDRLYNLDRCIIRVPNYDIMNRDVGEVKQSLNILTH